VVILLFFNISSSGAQDTQARYVRKSISFVDAILPLGDVRLQPRQEDFLLQEIRREIEMSRFDYNPLPVGLTSDFRQALRQGNARDPEAVAEAMNQTLVPEIIRILDYEKQMRAQGLVSEAERHSFVVEKAKETGITEADLRAIMNSAYIYLPVLYHAEVSVNRKSNSASADLKGGILWFRVTHTDSGSSVTLLAQKTAVGYAWSRLEAHDRKGRDLRDGQSAFTTAAQTLARNLRVATQEIPEFQLTNPLTVTGPGWVEFSLGKAEGVNLDDKFIIAEFALQPDSTLERKKLGMVRVTQVGKNTDGQSDSHARTVIGAGFQPGMVALEHPRLPIDFSFRLAMLPVNVTAGKIDKYETSNLYALEFDRDVRSHLYAGQLWFNYNLAQSTKIPQFFASAYGEVGGGKLTSGKAFGENLPVGFYWGAGGGLTKKFFVNRFHLGLEGLLSYARYQVDGKTMVGSGQMEWKWTISNVGLTMNGNLEIALGYDVNLGGGLSYRAFSYDSDWSHAGNDGQFVPLPSGTGNPRLSFGGVGYQVYLTWSLPTLGVDPIKAMQGVLWH
jgi:hypothetical protein